MSRGAKCAAIAAIGWSYVITLTLTGLNAVSLLLGLALTALSAYLASRCESSSRFAAHGSSHSEEQS